MTHETLADFKEQHAERVRRAQREYAVLYAAWQEHGDIGGRYAINMQRHLAQLFRVIDQMMDWLLDESFMADWFERYIMAREEHEREMACRDEERIRRLAAMTPTEREAHQRDREAMMASMTGLVTRDVQ